MCRYSDVSRLNWGIANFESVLSSLAITFEIRKNSQFRQGNKITAVSTNDNICPLKLLLKLELGDVYATSKTLFWGFNGRLVAKSPKKTAPSKLPIKYDQYVRYLSLYIIWRGTWDLNPGIRIAIWFPIRQKWRCFSIF